MYCNVIVFELTVHFGWNFYHVPSLLPHSCYSFVFHSSFFSEISLNNLFKHELPSAIKTLHFPTSFLFLQHLLYPHPMHEHSVFTHTHTHKHRGCIHFIKYSLHYNIIAGYVFSSTCSLCYFKCLTKWYALSKCLI